MVKVWTNENCIQCDRTKKFLSDNNIDFLELSLMDNPEQTKQFIDAGFRTAPIVETNSDRWSGFKLDKLKGLVIGDNQ